MATKRTIHFVSLGCPKNRVDTEVMLGVADAARAARIVDDAGRGRGHRRQHLRLHRRGEEGVDRHDPRDGRATRRAARCKKLVVTGCLSQRYPEELAARDARGRPLPRLERHAQARRRARAATPSACSSATRPTGSIRASDPRVVTALARERLPEDRRGVQPHLLVLRHPADSRQAALAHASTTSCARPSGSSAQGVRRAEPHLAGHDRLRARPRRRPSARRSPTLVRARRRRAGRALGAPLLPLPGDDRRRARRAPRAATRASCRTSTCRSSTRPTRCSSACGAATAGPAAARGRAPARATIPGLTFRTAFIVGHPGETDGRVRRALRVRDVGASSSTSASSATRTRRRARASRSTARCRRASRRNRYRKLMALQRTHRAREEPRARRPRARGARRGRERRARVRDHGAPRRAGAGHRRPGVPLRRRGRARQIRRVVITQASDYDLVGELQGESTGVVADQAFRSRVPGGRVKLRVVPADHR